MCFKEGSSLAQMNSGKTVCAGELQGIPIPVMNFSRPTGTYSCYRTHEQFIAELLIDCRHSILLFLVFVYHYFKVPSTQILTTAYFSQHRHATGVYCV